jgi:hypothetical protein
MSTEIELSKAISFTPIVPYQVQSDWWLEAAGMTPERYSEEMDVVMDCFYGHLHPVLDMMNELPDTPDVKVLKSRINSIIRAPFTRPQNPMTMMLDCTRVLADVVEHYHTTRGKRLVRAEGEKAKEASDLKAISPQNVNQRRAMVLLKILKAKPKEGLHTDDCKRILEGAEGTSLDSKVVRRAMCVLAEIYNPRIVCEKIDGSYRVRTNF